MTISDKRQVWASVGRFRVMYRDFGKVGEVAYGGEGGCIKGVQWWVLGNLSVLRHPPPLLESDVSAVQQI